MTKRNKTKKNLSEHWITYKEWRAEQKKEGIKLEEETDESHKNN